MDAVRYTAPGHDAPARSRWMALIAALLGWMFDGFEIGMFPLVGRPALGELLAGATKANIDGWFGVIMAVFLIGAATGGVVFGWLGNRIGRVRAMSLSILTYALFTGACGLATEAWHIAVLRFIASLGMGGELSLGVALVNEMWPERSRGWIAGLIGAASNVGIGLATVAGAAGTAAVIVVWSPAIDSYLARAVVPPLGILAAYQGFLHPGWMYLARARKAGQIPVDEVATLNRRLLQGALLAGVALLGTWGSLQWALSWAIELTRDTPQTFAKEYTQLTSSIGAVIGTLVAASLAGLLGRRLTYALLRLGSVASLVWLYQGHTEFNRGFLGAVCLAGGVTAAFYGWFPLYLPELFPTAIRATSQAFAYNFSRVVAAIGTLQTAQVMGLFGGSFPAAGSILSVI
jgi:MFS transporter, SHS family, sialic acid transporter